MDLRQVIAVLSGQDRVFNEMSHVWRKRKRFGCSRRRSTDRKFETGDLKLVFIDNSVHIKLDNIVDMCYNCKYIS